MATTENPTPPFPDVTVALSEMDGNAFFILGSVRKALRRGGAGTADLDEFTREATAGGYDHLLQTVMAWVDTE